MSDIGPFPGLDRVVMVFFGLLLVGPPVVLGTIFLVLHIFRPGRGSRWTALYFATSVTAVFGDLWWWSDWVNDPESFTYAVPMAVASSAGIFGIFLGVRWLIRWIRGKTREIKG
jgi:hypothetical protein